MNLHQRTRRILRLGGGVAGAALLLFLLRWPLFGGLVRGEVQRQARQLLQADLWIGELRGSLLTGWIAEDVELRPLKGSPLRAGTIRRLRVSYGFLGWGRLDVRVHGADIALSERTDEARPATESIREASALPFSLKIPGTVRVSESRVRLPGGPAVAVDSVRWKGSTIKAEARTPLGPVQAALSTTEGGGLALSASAPEAPISRLEVRLDEGAGTRALAAQAWIGERFVEWRGTAAFDAEQRLQRLHGALTGDEGRIDTSADFMRGLAAASGRVTLHVRRGGLDARVTLEGSASGPAEGPLEAWEFGKIRMHASRPVFRGIEFDDATLTMPGARGTTFPVELVVRRGEDRFQAEGTISPSAGISAAGIVRFRIADPRNHGLPGPPLSGRATATYGDGRFQFAGRLQAGTYGLELVGRRADTGEFTVTFSLTGPGANLSGKATGRASDISATVGGAAGGFRADRIELRAARSGDSWSLDMAPGILEAGARAIRHGPIRVSIDPGRARLGRVTIRSDPAALTLAGAAEWTAERVTGWIDGRDLLISGEEAPGFRLEASADLDGRAGTGRFSWGDRGADHLIVHARVDETVDVRVSARIRRFADLPVRVPGLRGSLAFEAEVTGPRAEPNGRGTLTLRDVSLGGFALPLLEVPLQVDRHGLAIPPTRQETAYGVLGLSGTLPWSGAADVRGSIEIADPAPLLERIPEKARPWIPRAIGRIDATLAGRFPGLLWRAEAEFRCAAHDFPDPVGDLSGLHVEAAADSNGVVIRSIRGELGRGPFRGEGRWSPRAGLTLSLTGSEMLAASTPAVRVRVSPQVAVSVNDEGVAVTGRVDVPLALYYEEFGRGGGGSAGTFGLRWPRSALGGVRIPGLRGLRGVRIDLHAVSGRELRIENSTAGVLLEADVRLRGTADAPSLTGRILARRGEIRLATGLYLRIANGEIAILSDPEKEATVAFEGVVGAGPTAVTVVLSGRLADPSLSLRSTPPRRQEELLAMIAFGHLPGTVEGSSAIGVVTGKILENLTDAWPKADPDEGVLDRIRLEVVEEQAAQSARVPWALPVRGSARGPVVRTEYRLNDYVSLVAESDQEANLAGDVRIRIRFRF